MKKTLVAAGMLSGAFLAVHSAWAISGEELARRQARSVHLQYSPTAANAVSARGTVTVTETQTNTYFCILAWDCGYCGIQDLGRRGRILIFSVWDPVDQMDFAARPEDVKEELRAKVLYAREDVDVARFGGEGTGARTMTQVGWEVGKPVSVRIDAEPDGTNRTAYTCRYLNPESGEWERIASVSTLLHEGRARGINRLYSFVEDFWRNYHSATLVRRAEFSGIETQAAGTEAWTKATAANFTADGTPSNAIDAGPAGKGGFFLQTGGSTTNAHVRLWGRVSAEL